MKSKGPFLSTNISLLNFCFSFEYISLTQLNIFIMSIRAEVQDLSDDLTYLNFKTLVWKKS